MGREGGGWEPGKSQVPHLNADNSNTATMAVTLGNNMGTGPGYSR